MNRAALVIACTFGLAGCVSGSLPGVHQAVPAGSVRAPAGGPPANATPIDMESLPLNQLQFYGSHNSYKTAIPEPLFDYVRDTNPPVARALEYWHPPLAQQLDMGLRVLELDVFYDPDHSLFQRHGTFPVLHVQYIDTGSHCENLDLCLDQILAWADANPHHEPVMISFNAKTQRIEQEFFVVPKAFDAAAWQAIDRQLRDRLGNRLITPVEVLSSGQPRWPTLSDARGRFLLLLDERPDKLRGYAAAVDDPAMFGNWPMDDPRAAIQVLNDPVADRRRIAAALAAGCLVRTRADADTEEARYNRTQRRDAAFASGAQFISTDYYLPATHFDSDYVVTLPGGGPVRCNPVLAGGCVTEGL